MGSDLRSALNHVCPALPTKLDHCAAGKSLDGRIALFRSEIGVVHQDEKATAERATAEGVAGGKGALAEAFRVVSRSGTRSAQGSRNPLGRNIADRWDSLTPAPRRFHSPAGAGVNR
jgi:hypothetical protein